MERFYSKLRLAMLGEAVGDSFGAPFEYHKEAPTFAQMSIDEGRYLDGWEDVRNGARWCRAPGVYTDDTQQALCLIRARLETDGPDEAAAHFRSTIRAMAAVQVEGSKFGSHRGTGGNFRQAVVTGRPPPTAGLGAAMRVGPVAIMFDHPQEVVEWVLAVSAVTTSDPVGLACAAKFAAIAWAVAYVDRRREVRDVEWPTDIVPADVWDATTTALKIMHSHGEEELLGFARATGWANKEMRCAANGFGLTGFAWAAHHGLTGRSFGESLVGVCSNGGDTDTVGAMAGCIAALKHGSDAVPRWMIDGLWNANAVLNPWDWQPDDEIEGTVLDGRHRESVAAKIAAEQAAARMVRGDAKRENLDIFDLAGEAEAEEAAARAEAKRPVLFASKGSPKEYKHFGNFAPRPIVIGGVTWPTVEHYYQAAKTDDPEWRENIRLADGPGKAKRLGRQCPMIDGWDDLKYDIMFGAVRAKFEQHADLLEALLSTGERPIHEDRPDEWWGGGPNYPDGRDWLGQILVGLRALFRGGG